MSDTKELETQLQQKHQELEELRQEFADYKADCDEYEKALEEDNNSKDKEIELLKSKCHKLEVKNEENKKEINSLNKIMDRNKEKYGEIEARAKEDRQKIVQLEQDNETISNDLRQMSFIKLDLEEKLNKIEEVMIIEREDLKEKLSQKIDEVERVKQQLSESQDEVNALRKQIENMQGNESAGNEKQEIIDKYEEELDSLKKQIQMKNIENDRSKKKIKKLEEQLKKEAEKLAQEKENQQNGPSDLENQLKEIENKLSLALKEKDEAQDELQKFNSYLSSQEIDSDRLFEINLKDLLGQKNFVSSSKSETVEFDNELHALEQRIIEKNEEIQKLQEDIKKKDEQLQVITKKVSTIDIELDKKKIEHAQVTQLIISDEKQKLKFKEEIEVLKKQLKKQQDLNTSQSIDQKEMEEELQAQKELLAFFNTLALDPNNKMLDFSREEGPLTFRQIQQYVQELKDDRDKYFEEMDMLSYENEKLKSTVQDKDSTIEALTKWSVDLLTKSKQNHNKLENSGGVSANSSVVSQRKLSKSELLRKTSVLAPSNSTNGSIKPNNQKFQNYILQFSNNHDKGAANMEKIMEYLFKGNNNTQH